MHARHLPRASRRFGARGSATLTLAVAIALLSACGGGGDPVSPDPSPGPGPGPTNGSMTARIDGNSWSALSIQAISTASSSNIISIGAANLQAAFGFAWIDNGPGTYTIGQAVGFNATLTVSAANYTAAGSLGSGTLTVTTRTAERVAGTFSFTMVPSAGSSGTGTRNVTNGVFDVRF